jgi:hypothetical protein
MAKETNTGVAAIIVYLKLYNYIKTGWFYVALLSKKNSYSFS